MVFDNAIEIGSFILHRVNKVIYNYFFMFGSVADPVLNYFY